MRIILQKKFEKRYAKLDLKTKIKVDEALMRFRLNPFDPMLRNHALRGTMKGKRAFFVANDLRMVFEEFDNYVLVIMLDVGTHNQVYGI